MQHRRKKRIWLLIPLALLACGFVFLLLKDVPAPHERIDKPLEAAKFIKPNT